MAAPTDLGKYRLIAELGHGGMADVYLAMVGGPTGSGFTKLAVIKRLRANLVEDPDFVAMLVDEARISARLNHPNVVQTLEVGFEHEEYYLALEFLEGQPLHRLQRRALRSGVPFPRELACLVVGDVLNGLHYAHELADYDGSPLGIVHRDVNPQNVFVTYDGAVKVLDFGIAKATGRLAETKVGVIKGKIRYMSPEQAYSTQIDRRSDVFAAGLLLWEAAAGRRFWGEANDLDVIQALVSGEFEPSPRAVDPTVPAPLDAMCRKALASSPDDRYQSTLELREELESYLGDSMVNARRRLGALVSGLFEKERAEVRALIEQASRSNHEPRSMTTLLAAVPTPISIVPVNMAARSSALPTAPQATARRPRLAMSISIGAILASVAILAIELLNPAGYAPFGAAPPASRETGEVVVARARFIPRSAAAKAPLSAPSVIPRVAAPVRAAPPRRPAPIPPASSEPTPQKSVPVVAPAAKTDTHRRSKATLDSSDPWTKPPEDAK